MDKAFVIFEYNILNSNMGFVHLTIHNLLVMIVNKKIQLV